MRQIALLTAFVCLGFFLIPPHAEADDFELVTFFDYYGGIEPSQGYENLRTRYFVRPRFSGFNETLNADWVLSSSLWVQPLGEPYAINPWDILHEAYVTFPFKKFEFTLGQRLLTHGFADIYGPLNALHSTNAAPLSLDDAYDSRRPDPMAQLKIYPTFEDSIELIYIPLTRPDRERPDNVFLPETEDTIIWDRSPYILETPHSVFLNYSRYGEKADFQLFYGWYTENTPDFFIEEISSEEPVDIIPVYHKKHTLGGAYATRLGNTTLSQDLAFNLTSDWAGTDLGAANSDITLNTQLLMNLPGNILGQFSLVYAYFFNHGKHDPGDDKEAADYLAAQFQNFHNQPYQHIAFIVGHFERSFLREKLKAQFNTAFFFSPNVYLAPRLAYNVTDHWALEAGADITLGNPPDNDLRRSPANDNFYTRILFRY